MFFTGCIFYFGDLSSIFLESVEEVPWDWELEKENLIRCSY